MDTLITPAFGPFGEEARCGTDAPRRAPAIAHQPVADIVVERDEKVARFRGRDGLEDFPAQGVGNALVAIDFKDPRSLAGLDAGVVTITFQGPGSPR